MKRLLTLLILTLCVSSCATTQLTPEQVKQFKNESQLLRKS